MFLTRMPLNSARRQARFLLASPQAMHAAVLSGFPPDARLDGPEGRVLWRVDVQRPHTYLYVVSPGRPILDHLVEQAGWPDSSGWETTSYLPFLERVASGMFFPFRLVANPVRQSRDPQHLSRRLPHVTVHQQQKWLTDRALAHGFQVPLNSSGEPDVLVTRTQRHQFSRGSSTVTLATAQFDGRLEIVNTEIFRRTLTHGIGRAKGYGCGLLTVAAAKSYG